MRNTTIWWMAALSLAALGCSGSGGSGGLTPEPVPTGNALPQTGTAGLGAVAVNGDLSQSALALFTIDVDPSTLSAAVRLKETRQATATDDVYHLSIGNFMNAGTVKVTNITGTATTLDISYAVTHPFGVPADLDAPATAANRLDLGISGRVLFMADVASAAGNTYFTDVVANTSLVRNADGLVRPRGMLDTTGFTANTFPFKSLVDETQDPRTGTASGSAVSNGGLVTGNYDGTTGWQRSNLGGNKDGWTGYGTLHQGQTASNMVSLDLATISAGGSFSMDVAILAKYQDPRGGSTPTQKKANRLPAATADINQFAYRRPHGSNDLESVRFEGESGGYVANQLSGSTLSFHVADWDARATETAETDLAADATPTNVAIGESGAPTLRVSIPGVTGDETSAVDLTAPVVDDDSGFGGDIDTDSGQPGDALFYSETVTKAVTSGQTGGTFTGLVEATDVENGQTTDWSFPLDPDLGLLTADIPEARVYQAFTVDMPSLPPSATSWSVTTATVTSGSTAGISIAGITDPDAGPVDVMVDWDNDGVYTLATTANSPYPGTLPLTSPISYTYSGSSPDTRTLKVRLEDGTNSVDLLPDKTFTVVPLSNQPPSATSWSVTTPSVASNGTASINIVGITDPENNGVQVLVDWDNDGTYTLATAVNSPYPANLPLTSPITYTFTPPAPDTRTLKVRLTDGGTPVNLLPDQTFTVTPGSGWAVSANMAGATNIVDQSYGVAPDPVTGGTYVYGTFVNTGGLDFGGGNRPLLGNQTFYLVKYDANGGYLWDRTWGRSSSGRAIGLTTDAAGNVYAGGTWATNLLISGLGGGAVDQVCGGGFFAEDHFILKFDPSGTYQALWRTNDTIDSFQSAPNGLTGATTSHGASPKSLLVNQTTGDVYYCGTWTGGTGIVSNFGIPGPTAAGGRDAWIVKLNSSLAPQWVTALHSAGGASNMYATALALDPTGNLIVTGAWDGATSQDYFGTGTPMASAGGVDAYVMRRNSTTGALVPGSLMTWGTTTAEVFECVTSDTNRMYIGGWTNSIVGAALPGGGTTPIIATGTASNVEGFVAAWNHSNTFQWQRVFTGQGQDMPNDLATNGTNLYACGLMVNVAGGIPTNLGYGTRSAGAGGAAFLVRFGAATGALDGWDRHWDTGGAGLDNALALNMSGTSLVMAGMWTGPLGTAFDFDPGAGTFNRTSLGSNDGFGLKISGSTGTF